MKILEKTLEIKERNVLILELLKTNNKLKILALDIFSGNVVKIVDYNNEKFGLHAYFEDMLELKNRVIKAKFKICDNNILMLKGEYSILGEGNLNSLNNKFWSVYNEALTLDFKSLEAFSKKYPSSNLYVLVNFTNTQLKKYELNGKIKYQLNMSKNFINVCQTNIEKYVGLNFKGVGLITWNVNNKGNVVYYADALYGNFKKCNPGENVLSNFEKKQIINKVKVELQNSSLFDESFSFEEYDEDEYDYEKENLLQSNDLYDFYDYDELEDFNWEEDLTFRYEEYDEKEEFNDYLVAYGVPLGYDFNDIEAEEYMYFDETDLYSKPCDQDEKNKSNQKEIAKKEYEKFIKNKFLYSNSMEVKRTKKEEYKIIDKYDDKFATDFSLATEKELMERNKDNIDGEDWMAIDEDPRLPF